MKEMKLDLLKVIIGTIVTSSMGLFVYCIVTIYNSNNEVLKTIKELSLQLRKDNLQLCSENKFAKEIAHIGEESVERVLELGKLYELNDEKCFSDKDLEFWKKHSFSSKMKVIQELANLEKYSVETIKYSISIKKALISLLDAELDLWRSADALLETRGAANDCENDIKERLKNLNDSRSEYTKAMLSIGPNFGLMVDKVPILYTELSQRYSGKFYQIKKLRRDIMLSIVGIVCIVSTAFLVAVIMNRKRLYILIKQYFFSKQSKD